MVGRSRHYSSRQIMDCEIEPRRGMSKFHLSLLRVLE